MPIIQSCCCWRSLRKGCYAAAIYTLVYFSITVVTMGHFIEVERRYLSGEMEDPESESFLEPEKITPITVVLNLTLLACSSLGLISCGLLVFGVRKDIKNMLLPWIGSMSMETLVEMVNLVYLFYLQTINFNPVTSFLFTLDFFLILLNIYALVCVISQYQEYRDGRGTAEFDNIERPPAVQYTAAAQHTLTTSSGGRRRSAGRPLPSRCDPDEFSEAPKSIGRSVRPMASTYDPEEFSEVPTKTTYFATSPVPSHTKADAAASMRSKPSRSAVKKHVQFPDDSFIEEGSEMPDSASESEKPDPVFSTLWVEIGSEAQAPER